MSDAASGKQAKVWSCTNFSGVYFGNFCKHLDCMETFLFVFVFREMTVVLHMSCFTNQNMLNSTSYQRCGLYNVVSNAVVSKIKVAIPTMNP